LVRLQGKADEFAQVNKFDLNLKKSKVLASYGWNTPPPSESNERWNFVYDGGVTR